MPLTSILSDGSNVDKPALRAYLAAQEIASILDEDYGGVGDGIANNAAAMTAANAKTGRVVYFPKGRYLCNSNLPAPVCSGWLGEGMGDGTTDSATEIICGAGVTKLLSLPVASGNFRRLEHLCITGNGTTNAKGIVIGDGSLSPHISLYNVWVRNFTGTNGIGIHHADSVGTRLTEVIVSGCTTNHYFELLTNGGCPSNVTFWGGSTLGAIGNGMVVKSGQAIRLHDHIIEESALEGLDISPDTFDVTEFGLYRVHFENNNNADADNYQVLINPDDRTVRTIWEHVTFSGTARSVHHTVTGTGAAHATINNLIMVSAANQFVNDSGAQGDVMYWGNTDPAVTLNDPLGYMNGSGMPWFAWTPVYGSFYAAAAHSAADTFTGPGTVTTNGARTSRQTKTGIIMLNFAATLNAVTPTYLYLTLPTGWLGKTNAMYTSCPVKNNGIWETGLIQSDGDNKLVIHRENFAAFTSGGAVGAIVTFTMEFA